MQIGDRVKFRPTHQKELELTGTVRDIGTDVVEIETDEANGSVSRLYVAHAADCSVLAEAGAVAQESPVQETAGETETASDEAEPIDRHRKRKHG